MECANCGTKFNYRVNLVRHLKMYREVDCRLSHNRRQHLKSPRVIKSTDVTPERKEFISEAEFELWKLDIERKTCSLFVPKRGNYKSKNFLTKYYICNRSGFFRQRVNDRKRRMKSQGTGKINGTCPASITIKIFNSGEVLAEYVLVHNHSMDPQHLRIQKLLKDELAARLKEGMSKTEILSDVHNLSTQDDDIIDRVSMLGRKDLQNIIRDYKIEHQIKNISTDLANFDLWVQEKFEGKENPVLFFKQRGDLDAHGFLDDEDFAVIMMTSFQKEMLSCIGSDRICIDETLGTNFHPYQLLTLLTVDVSGKAFPFAFCLSNRKSRFLYDLFFRSIREHVGNFKCTVFMSNDEPLSYDSWSDMMDERPRHRFVYTWRVLDGWKNNLSKCPANKRSRVSRALRNLLRESKVNVFEEMLKNFVRELCSDPELKQFHNYFTSTYVDKAERWALCYRECTSLCTNNNLETVHRLLKQAYLEGAETGQLYRTLDALIAFVRDAIYENRIQITEEIRTRFDERIRESHDSGSRIILTSIRIVGARKWDVYFENTDCETFTVERRNERTEECDCEIKCELCNVCIHEYSCSCYDSSIVVNICDHVHAVATFQSSIKSTDLLADEVCPVNEIEIENYTDYDDEDDIRSDLNLPLKNVPPELESTPNIDNSSTIAQKLQDFTSIYGNISSAISEEDKHEIEGCMDKMLAICSKYCDLS